MPAELGVALLGEQPQVVDPGARRWWWDLPLGLRVCVTADHQWDGEAHRAVLVANLDPGQIERVEHQLDLPTDQRRIDLILVAVQRHGRGLRHRPLLAPQERFPQQCRGRQPRHARGLEPLERRHSGLRMGASVVDDLKPRGEQAIELRKLDTVIDLDQELIADRPKKALNLALRGGRARACVNQFHAEHGARAEQLGGHERGAAVNQNPCRNATRHQPSPQRGLQAEHVLAGTPPPADQQSAVIVDEREQHRPPRRRAGQDRAVETVARPQLIPRGGLEPAIDLPR